MNNPKASLLARDDVQTLIRIVAHYSESNQQFESKSFGDKIPADVYQKLRVINHGAVAAAFGVLVQHCHIVVCGWYEEFRAKELAELATNLHALGMEESGTAHYAFFGIGDFTTPVNPPET